MRINRFCISALLYAVVATASAHAATVQYVLSTPVSTLAGEGTLYQYTYYVTDIVFLPNQEIDILFSPDRYGNLSNGIADSSFNVMLFQPSDPMGTAGHFSALALQGIAAPLQFQVNFRYIGQGVPGSQQFAINQFDVDRHFLGVITTGSTSRVGPGGRRAGAGDIRCRVPGDGDGRGLAGGTPPPRKSGLTKL